MSRGIAVVLRPGEWHGYRACSGLVVNNVYLGEEVLANQLQWLRYDLAFSRLLRYVKAPDLANRSLQVSEDSTLQIDRITKNMQSAKAVQRHETVQIGLVLQLLGLLAGALSADNQEAVLHPSLVAVLQAVGLELSADWSAERLARAGHVSVPYLHRLFKDQMQTSPMSFVAERRAERMAGLLIESDLAIGAIGGLVGWRDPNHAARRFRQSQGVSPSRYRMQFGRK